MESDVNTLTIGQLASLADISVEAIRFYEREGLLIEAERGPSGYRKFPDSAAKRLRFIHHAKLLGFTLKEIKNLLAVWSDQTATHEEMCQAIDKKVIELDAKAQELLEKAQWLKQLCADCRLNNLAQDCPVMKALAGVDFEGDDLTSGAPTPARCRANHGL